MNEGLITRKILNEIRETIFGEKAVWDDSKQYFTFKTKGKNAVTYKQLEMYHEAILERVGGPEKIKLAVQEVNREFNIGTATQIEILKSLNIKDGLLTNLSENRSAKFMPLYRLFARTHGENRIPQTHVLEYIQRLEGDNAQLPTTRGIQPIYNVLKNHLGEVGNFIADKFVKFDVAFTREYMGEGSNAIYMIQTLLGAGIFTTGGTKHVWLWDGQRAKQSWKNLTAKEKEFYEKSHDGTIVFKNIKTGKLVTLTGESGNNKKLKYMNNENYEFVKMEGTPQFQAKHIHDKLMNFYWKSLHKEVKRHNNDVEYRDFENHLTRR